MKLCSSAVIASYKGYAAAVVVACLLAAGTGCSNGHTTSDTCIYADISQSVFNRQVTDYRSALFSTLDATAPNTPVELHTFANQTSVAKLPLLYQGSPEGADDLMGKILEIYPDQPGAAVTGSGTSFQAVLSDIIDHCQQNANHSVRAVIVTDGGLCQPQTPEHPDGDDLKEMNDSAALVAKLAALPNFKGILILPVDGDGQFRQILSQKVFSGLIKAGKSVRIVPKDEVDDALETFRKL